MADTKSGEAPEPVVTITAGPNEDVFDAHPDTPQIPAEAPAKAKPEKKPHPQGLVRRAQRFNIPQHRIDAVDSERLEDLVDFAEDQFFQQFNRQPEHRPEPKPEPAKVEDDEYEPALDDNYAPELKNELKRLHKIAEQKAKNATAKEAAELKAELAILKKNASDQSQAQQLARLEQLFLEDKSIFGSMKNAKVQPGTREYLRRNAVLRELSELVARGQHTDLDSDYASIRDAMYGEPEEKAEEKPAPKAESKPDPRAEVNNRIKDWNNGALARPNASNGKSKKPNMSNIQASLDRAGYGNGPQTDDDDIGLPD